MHIPGCNSACACADKLKPVKAFLCQLLVQRTITSRATYYMALETSGKLVRGSIQHWVLSTLFAISTSSRLFTDREATDRFIAFLEEPWCYMYSDSKQVLLDTLKMTKWTWYCYDLVLAWQHRGLVIWSCMAIHVLTVFRCVRKIESAR
jgi:hypothetical protein